MMCIGQNREGACAPKASLATPKTSIRIGYWNVRSMFSVGKTAQIACAVEATNSCASVGIRREEEERLPERNLGKNG